jgi:hypothetical protein
MRKWTILGAIGVALLAWSGCNGMVRTYEGRMNTLEVVMDRDLRQLADDWDLLWLADRQYRLSNWSVR